MSSQFLRCQIKTFFLHQKIVLFCLNVKSNPVEIIKIDFIVKFVGKLILQTSVKFKETEWRTNKSPYLPKILGFNFKLLTIT